MLQSCDLTTGNSAAPTPCCQLSPATSGTIISNVGKVGQSQPSPYNDQSLYHHPNARSMGKFISIF